MLLIQRLKRLCINDIDGTPSYQYHHKRSEIWVIVKGTAEIKLDDEVKEYGVGDVINIPGKVSSRRMLVMKMLVFIEIQLWRVLW